jgi:hypothetical protein
MDRRRPELIHRRSDVGRRGALDKLGLDHGVTSFDDRCRNLCQGSARHQ